MSLGTVKIRYVAFNKGVAMDVHTPAPSLEDDELAQVSGGTLGAAISDGIAVGGSTGLNSTVSPTEGYGDGDPSGEGADNEHAVANGVEESHASDYESNYGYDATQPA